MKTIQKILDSVKNMELPSCSQSDHFNYPLTDIGLYSSFNNMSSIEKQQLSKIKKNELQGNNSESNISQSTKPSELDLELEIFCPICRYNNDVNAQEEQQPFDTLPIKIFLKNLIEKLNSQIINRESLANQHIENIKIQIKDVKTIRRICQIIEQNLREALNSYSYVLQMRDKSELFVEDILCQMLQQKKCNSRTFREQFTSLQKECAVLFSDASSKYEISLKSQENKSKQQYSQQIEKMLHHSQQMISIIKQSLEQNLHEFDQTQKLQEIFQEIKVENEAFINNLHSQKQQVDKFSSSLQSIEHNDLSSTCQTIFKEELNKLDLLNKQTENFILNMSLSSAFSKNKQQFSDSQTQIPQIFINNAYEEQQQNQNECVNQFNQDFNNYYK